MHPLHHTPGPKILTNQALPLIVPQVARLDTRVQALHYEVREIVGEARNATMCDASTKNKNVIQELY